MKLHHLRALVAVADEGSMRGAARSLDLTVASIGASIRQFEAETELCLIQRTSRGAMLTEAARTLLPHARIVIAQLKHAQEDVDAMRGTASGWLSFGVTPWVAQAFLPQAIVRFQAKYPDIHFQIFEGHPAIVNPRLRDGTISFIIGRRAPNIAGSEISFRPVCLCGYGIVARLGHPGADGRSLADLCDFDFLLCTDPDVQGQLPIFVRNNLPMPKAIHYVHSISVVVYMLQRSNMLSIFPWPLIEIEAKHKNLCAISVREQIDEQEIGIVTRAGHPLGVAASFFIDCLVDAIHETVEKGSSETRRLMQAVDLLL
ncbi:LysR family transcriptional regulator [Paraburkholderia antibiotica]|uniref:LysR family transcriptional regulator n=1 Tax=Paraburkholderia antibiotica TaxID=2728839 RepID=A0A7Y0FG90_9BURK|nr:LysR family transcriptional regulator [Paraburkholderia antibiotica]NML34907.1 LysR family transcriptional regulator [Paraburkholderia antibiotica]